MCFPHLVDLILKSPHKIDVNLFGCIACQMDASVLQRNFSKKVFVVSMGFNRQYRAPLIKCITYVCFESSEIMSGM